MKKLFKTQAGRFIAGLTALLLTIAATAGAGHMNFLKADMTAQQVMTIDPAAAQIARAIDKEAAIYYLTSEQNKDVWLDELLKKYEALNPQISYEVLDLAAAVANGVYASAVSENMIIVSSEDRMVSINESDMYRVTYDLMQYYISNQMVVQSQVFAADEEIINALLYVTREDMPVLYMLSGHGETMLSGTALEEMRQNNIDVRTLTLDGVVPEDAALVMICAPMMDITQAEADALLDYVQAGGKLAVMTNYLLLSAPNLYSVMAHYGMQSKYGIAVDAAEGYCYGTEVPYYLTPDVSEHGITQALLKVNSTMLMPMCGALERNEVVRDALIVTELMNTSESAYLKNPLSMTVLEKEDGDADGPFTLAMAAEEGESRVVWFAGTEFIGDESIEYSSLLNLYILDGIRDWMLPETDQRISIEDENLLSESLSVPENQKVIVYAALFAPALLMLIAGIILLPRKRIRAAKE